MKRAELEGLVRTLLIEKVHRLITDAFTEDNSRVDHIHLDINELVEGGVTQAQVQVTKHLDCFGNYKETYKMNTNFDRKNGKVWFNKEASNVNNYNQ